MRIDNNKLDLIMAEKCLTSKKLSLVTGVSQVSIARFRRGAQEPRPATIGKIAKALEISPMEFIIVKEGE